MPSHACDPLDEVFANMLVGLREAALTNAGVTPEEFLAAVAVNGRP
jgi:hypothetical protein